jgi:hypothetical protein
VATVHVSSVSDLVLTATNMKFLGNRFVEAHVHGNAQVKETTIVEACVTYAVLP